MFRNQYFNDLSKKKWMTEEKNKLMEEYAPSKNKDRIL